MWPRSVARRLGHRRGNREYKTGSSIDGVLYWLCRAWVHSGIVVDTVVVLCWRCAAANSVLDWVGIGAAWVLDRHWGWYRV